MEKSFHFNNVIFVVLFFGNIVIEEEKFYFKIIYFLLSVYHIFVFYSVICNNWDNNKLKIRKFLILSILLYFFTYFIIYDTNPFFYLLVYYIFFPNFLKGILIVLIHTYFLSKFINLENENDISSENHQKLENSDEKSLEQIAPKIIAQCIDVENSKNNINNENNENIPLKDKKKLLDKYSYNLNNYYFLCHYINYFSKYKICFCYFLFLLVLILTIEVKLYFLRIKIWVHLNDKTQTLPIASSKNTTFYITAMIYNMENIIKNYLTEMIKLINYLGEQNVIISIVENGDSTDNTTLYLKNFQNYLNKRNITNRFLLEHEIDDPRLEELNFEVHSQPYLRIKYYAELRNKCFDLLYDLPNIDFDNTKIIYFNDIIFEYENIINLLSTNNEDYDAVCGLDFYDVFYDSWVSIDLSAYALQHEFPFFVNKEGQDLVIKHKPIRVFSCWNGVIIFTAAPLKNKNIQFRYELDFDREKINKLFSDQNYNFESECTYLHIDLFSMGYTKKFINPDVRVAYLYEYYNMKKDGYLNRIDIKNYFKLYFKGLFQKRNKDMSNYKDQYIRLNTVLEKWYLENKKNNF